MSLNDDMQVAATANTTTAMPLTYLTGDVDLNDLRTNGNYISSGKVAQNHPPTEDSEAAWSLQVFATKVGNVTSITQAFVDTNGTWWRSSTNNGTGWSNWKRFSDEMPPAMPLNPAPTNDLDEIKTDGFYQSKGNAATHAPNTDKDWILLVVTAPAGNPTYIAQTFYVGTEVWVRSKSNNAAWSAWKNVAADFPDIPPAMPLNPAPTNDLDQIKTDGFYQSKGTAATHAPSSSADWALLVVTAPASNPTYIAQTFYVGTEVWVRSKTNNAAWSTWKNVAADFPEIPPALLLKPSSHTLFSEIIEDGIYHSTGYTPDDSPSHDGWRIVAPWTLLVTTVTLNDILYIFQTLNSSSYVWHNVSSNGGKDWSGWDDFTSRLSWQLAPTNDINKLTSNGVFFSNLDSAVHGGDQSDIWWVQVFGNAVNMAYRITQMYYSNNGVWWRISNDGGNSWNKWVKIVGPNGVGAASFGSAYLLGDAIIPNNHFVPFDQSGPSQGLSFDAETGEIIIAQTGTYSLTVNLHLNSNQKASFAISIDGETPEHHSALHYEPAASILTGHYSATLTSIIECTEGQRVGIKNITGNSVTLWHAVNDRRSKHELILTQLDVHEEESE